MHRLDLLLIYLHTCVVAVVAAAVDEAAREGGGRVADTRGPTVIADLVRVGHGDVRKRRVDGPLTVGG